MCRESVGIWWEVGLGCGEESSLQSIDEYV